DVARLAAPDLERLRYVFDAVTEIRRALHGRVPLIGFAGSPWTLATYMVEGGPSKNFSLIKGMLYERPQLLHRLLDTLAQSVTSYLNAQVAAGAQALMIFDSWGGVLSTPAYQEFSLAYAQRILAGLQREADGRQIPVIFFTKGGGQWLESMADAGFDCLGIDWTIELGDARARVGNRVALQGNLDPSTLYAAPEVIRVEVARTLASFGAGAGHVFNLGHGIHPEIDPSHMLALVEAVHELSAPYHAPPAAGQG
ncbi:MAG TPA: uroporphyrinogen decarboxylase family protein, partial [Gammaproteobacteria bacterium]|nr:uroporphyrinogen decarboxylase family protein [Gammaproteobacteria bacterium]